MKTEPQIKELLANAMSNAMRSDSIEQLRFFQGQIAALENILGLAQDAFTDDKEEKK